MPRIEVTCLSEMEHGFVLGLQEQWRDEHRAFPKTLVISIQDVEAQRPVRVLCHNPTTWVLRLRFEDDLEGPLCIEPKDADLVVRFLLGHPDVDLIVTQCTAGQSRSAAVAAACAVILGQPSAHFFHDPFWPNTTVLHHVLDAWNRVRFSVLEG